MRKDHARATLERNLAALRRAQPELARRLAWPVDGSHVDPGPPARYLHHKAWVPLELSELGEPAEELARAAVAGGGVLVLGVGTGDLLDRALSAAPAVRVTAWDRDPWLLRLALGRTDRAARIAAGGLRLALGTDLLDLDLAGAARVAHPLLGRLYARDVALAERGGTARRAAVCTGGLLVESLGDALERAGYGVWPLPIQRLSVEELDHQLERLAPELLVAVNYTNGLAELAGRHGARLLAWEIDPTTTPPVLAARAPGVDRARVFTWQKSGVETFRRAGFAHAAHLPIGADVELRAPLALSPEERERYGAPISFAGASLVRNVAAFRERFLVRWARTGRARAAGEELIASALAEQRRDYSRYLIPELLAERAPELFERGEGDEVAEDPALLLGELAAAEKRLSYVANLGRFGAHVWGDPGWEPVVAHGVRWRGPAGHGAELSRIYNASGINADVGRLYQGDIVTLRTFDVLACGAFALVEHTDELAELFDVGREVASYRTLPELLAKAAHYLAHPAEATAIAAAGLCAVRERHTVEQRLAAMLAA